MRALFLGQKWLGDRCFDLLVDSGADVCAAVSNRDATSWWGTNGVWARAEREAIPFLPNDRRREDELLALIEDRDVDTILSVQHPWIIGPEVLRRVDGRAFNLHNAALPAYRGHNAVNHEILAGEETHTATVHWMVAEVDLGDAAVEETIPIASNAHARGLYDDAVEAGVEAFRELLDILLSGDEPPRRPLAAGGNFYPRSSLEELRELPDGASAETRDRRARALYFPPFEPAFERVAGRKVYLLPEGFERYAHEWGDRWPS